MYQLMSFLLLTTLPSLAMATDVYQIIYATHHPYAFIAIIIFVVAYTLVILEECISLRKSKPVVIASGIIWVLVAIIAQQKGLSQIATTALKKNILDYAELLLFLLVTMTYINTLEERRVFHAFKIWLINKGLSYKKLFWVTGIFAFCISPIADNLTTALIMCAVLLAVGADNQKFVNLGCINIVVAANAGGAFSPFGDITTLMVWQANVLPFKAFFQIFVPALISFIIPALCMHFAVPNEHPEPCNDKIQMLFGARRIILLFFLTIITAICFHNYFHLPSAIGMMTGLGYLKLFSYYIKQRHRHCINTFKLIDYELIPFDIIKRVGSADWDTLLFFYGVILSVGGLATIGYLESVSQMLYQSLGSNLPQGYQQTPANIIMGLLSAVIDNIPVMFAVLSMDPSMSQGQWLLVTLTTGIGGSLLSVGSAAGIALMGQAKNQYTFFSHFKWSWAILFGYIAACISHLWVNSVIF